MRPYNFLRAFRIALFTNRDYFSPPRGNHGQRVSGRYWKTRKGAGQKAWKVLRE